MTGLMNPDPGGGCRPHPPPPATAQPDPLSPEPPPPEPPPPARLLGRALFRREWRPAALAAAVALAVAGAGLGRLVAGRGLLPDPSGVAALPVQGMGSLGDFALWLLAGVLPLPIVLMAGVAAVDRLAGDVDAPWLATLAAAGMSRSLYVALVTVATATLQVALYAALATGYVVGAAVPGDHAGAIALHLLRGLPGVAALIVSTTLYGASCVALARRRGAALALALAGVAGPIAAVGWPGADVMRSASPVAARLLTLLMPPPAWTSSAEMLLRHALYSLVLLALLTRSAPRWVARSG